MRRSLWLVVATSWLLELGACGDQPTARTPHVARPLPQPRTFDVSLRPASGESSRAAAGAEVPGNLGQIARGPSNEPARDASATSEQLAARYGKARALAVQHGSGSYYSDRFAGRATASGAVYEPSGFTAAHRSLPFGSVLRVTRKDGGQSVYVRVTDRGPFGPRGRILDLSRAAAERLGMLRSGVIELKLEVVEYGQRKARRRRR